MVGIDGNSNSKGVLEGNGNGDGNHQLNCKEGLNGNYDGEEVDGMEGIDSNGDGNGG